MTITPRGMEYLQAQREAARAIDAELRAKLGEAGFSGLLSLLDALDHGEPGPPAHLPSTLDERLLGRLPRAVRPVVGNSRAREPSMLGIVTAALAIGTKHGRHGLRVIVLVFLLAGVVGLILWRRQRQRYRQHTRPMGPATPDSPVRGGQQPVTAAVAKRWEGHSGGHQNTVEARGLTKRYGDRLAVDDLSFDVRPGRVTGFLGPTGQASPQPCA